MADFNVGRISRLDFDHNFLRVQGATGRHGGATDQEQTANSNENPSTIHVETSYIYYLFMSYDFLSKICTKTEPKLSWKIFD
jgi:hypothetical protein